MPRLVPSGQLFRYKETEPTQKVHERVWMPVCFLTRLVPASLECSDTRHRAPLRELVNATLGLSVAVCLCFRAPGIIKSEWLGMCTCYIHMLGVQVCLRNESFFVCLCWFRCFVHAIPRPLLCACCTFRGKAMSAIHMCDACTRRMDGGARSKIFQMYN